MGLAGATLSAGSLFFSRPPPRRLKGEGSGSWRALGRPPGASRPPWHKSELSGPVAQRSGSAAATLMPGSPSRPALHGRSSARALRRSGAGMTLRQGRKRRHRCASRHCPGGRRRGRSGGGLGGQQRKTGRRTGCSLADKTACRTPVRRLTHARWAGGERSVAELTGGPRGRPHRGRRGTDGRRRRRSGVVEDVTAGSAIVPGSALRVARGFGGRARDTVRRWPARSAEDVSDCRRRRLARRAKGAPP